MTSAPRIKIALLSSGLGNTRRGFEASSARWFEALTKYTSLDVKLYCGGDHPGGKKLWNFSRDGLFTAFFRVLSFVGEPQRWELCYGTEQISFWSALNFELLAWRPDFIWVKDVPLSHLLIASRYMFGLKHKIIIANGGMLRPQTYKDFDVIQQLSLHAYEEAAAFGIPTEKMNLISNCFLPMVPTRSREEVRAELGYKPTDKVVICVAAWNRYHKRIDYLLNEVHDLNDPNVRVLLCGAPEVDTAALKRMGEKLLGDRVKWLTVAPDVVIDLLHASDIFVLPSVRESLGNVLVEAALCGLPIISHPHYGGDYILSDDYWKTDLSEPGNLKRRLAYMLANPPSQEQLDALRADVWSRFGAEPLAKKFEQMVLQSAHGSRTASGAASCLK